MAIKAKRVNVLTATATSLLSAAEPSGRTGRRKRITIKNNGPNPIYVADTDAVTSALGYHMPAADELVIEDGAATGALWAIAGTADQVTAANTSLLVEW